MGFQKCKRVPKDRNKPDGPKRNIPYKDIFFTMGPVPSSFLTDDIQRTQWETRIYNMAKARSWPMKDSPFFCRTEISNLGYHHMHIMVALDKQSAQWLGFCSDLLKLLKAMPKDDPPPPQQPNVRADFCCTPQGKSANEIMISYVTDPKKDKQVGVGRVDLDFLGPRPIKNYPKPECSYNSLAYSKWAVTRHNNEIWNERNDKLNTLRRYKQDVKSGKQLPYWQSDTPQYLARLEAWMVHYKSIIAPLELLPDDHYYYPWVTIPDSLFV